MTSRTHLISPRALSRSLGISLATLWRWTLDHMIPRPVFLGARIMGWERRVIDSWLNLICRLSLVWGAI